MVDPQISIVDKKFSTILDVEFSDVEEKPVSYFQKQLKTCTDTCLFMVINYVQILVVLYS